MRQIRLTFETGESALADLLDREAPQVAEYVWSLLPIEYPMIHGMYSGAEVFALLPEPYAAPPENLVQLPLPGELLFYHDDGSSAAGGRKPVAEICFVYGRGVVLRGPEGIPVAASLFARIPGDWQCDWVDFAKACRRCRRERPLRLRIERHTV